MNWQNEKDRKTLYSLGFLALAVLLTGFTAAEVISIARGTGSAPLLTKDTLEQISPDREKIQQYFDDYKTAARQLTRNNMFVPPPDTSEEPGDCTAIFGNEARIGNRWVKTGDRIGAAEVVAVEPTRITLLFEDRRITRSPVLKLEDNSRRSSTSGFSLRDQSRNIGANRSRTGRRR